MSHLKHQRDLELSVENSWLVDGLIPRYGITVVYGKPGQGKTFWALDIAGHIAAGWQYRGMDTEQGMVVYCTFEAPTYFPARVMAMRKGIELPDDAPLWVWDEFMTFSKKGEFDIDRKVSYQHQRIIKAAQEVSNGSAPVLVVLDTLNRILDGSENNDEDMTFLTKAAEDIARSLGCGVLIVHHCGADGSKPRGHTSLTGTCSAQIKISSEKSQDRACITAYVEKMKDGPDGASYYSWMNTIVVGKDNRDRDILSCYLEEAPPLKVTGPTKFLTNTERKALAILSRLCEHTGFTVVSRWMDACVSEGLSKGSEDSQKRAFRRVRDRLMEHGRIGRDDLKVWIVKTDAEKVDDRPTRGG